MLTEEHIANLRGRTPEDAARAIVTGQVGPLEGFGYPAETALVSWAIYRAYQLGRARGILKGRKAYEAKELLGHRARAAFRRAGGLVDFMPKLLELVGVKMDAMRPVQVAWWRREATLRVDLWADMKTDMRVEDAIAGAGTLMDTMHLLRVDDDDASPEPSEVTP
jgi:hypothetical protein